jgi:16S rRNA (cytosine1407-C5)-methyltransferase
MLNESFKDKYSQILGNDADSFFNGLLTPRQKFLRFARSRKTDYVSEAEETGIKLAKREDLPGVYAVEGGEELLTSTIGFQTGGYYIMNPSSVFAAKTLTDLMPDYPYILDVASAPGGKTCAIADLLGNRCAMIANEPSGKRMKSLQFNLEKHGAYSVRTVSKDGRNLHKVFDETFDGILLDAPCSNENKIGRNKTVNSEWCDELVEKMAKLQKEIASSAFATLKEGGVMVYSTCTFSIEENEDVVRHLLDTEDCEVVDINQGEHTAGIKGDPNIDPYVVRYMPHVNIYDGFFIAAVRKKGDSEKGGFIKKFKPNKDINHFFETFPEDAEIYDKGKSIHLTTQMDRTINFSKNGIMLFKREGELTSQALWQLGDRMPESMKSQISREDALKYLKGFDIEKTESYHGPALYYNDVPVGMSKPVNNTIKNKLDRYFLYGKNIEW